MNIMDMEPHARRIIVKPTTSSNVSAGGIHIPETAQQTATCGTVIAVGGKITQVQNGDTVHYAKYSGTELNLNGTAYLVLRETDILLKSKGQHE